MILNREICFLFPILKDTKKHYLENTISFVYGFTTSGRSEFLVGNGHYDIPKFESDVGLLRTKLPHIVYKKKCFKNHQNLIEADLLHWLNFGVPVDIELNTSLKFLHHRGLDNSLIPIFKWVEIIRSVKDKILQSQTPPASVVDSYHNIVNQFITIENAGICCNPSGSYTGEEGNHRRNLVFTEYNPFTLTGRPSNKFGGVNYAALNKIDGTRKKFISRFDDGFLIEFDFQAFHINLIAKILKYNFPEDPYLYLSKNFFHTETPSPEQIKNSKELTFQQVYGGVRPEYRQIEFFSKLDLLLRKIEMSNRAGTVKSFLFKKPIQSTDNHIKTFNYLLQNLETEINSLLITELHCFLEEKQTKLILYTYDSFLFDYSPADGKETIAGLKKILDKTGIQSRIKIGKNYHDMIPKKILTLEPLGSNFLTKQF